jgi:hypothetical protein
VSAGANPATTRKIAKAAGLKNPDAIRMVENLVRERIYQGTIAKMEQHDIDYLAQAAANELGLL